MDKLVDAIGFLSLNSFRSIICISSSLEYIMVYMSLVTNSILVAFVKHFRVL